MPSLSVSSYRTIEGFYSSGQQQLIGVADYYFNAAYEILTVQVFDPELDLLQPFYQAYLGARSAFLQTPQSIVQAVTSLQQHILNKALSWDGATETKFTNINDWLSLATGITRRSSTGVADADQTDITVSQEFADLSAQAGFNIVSCNIDGGPPC